MKMLTSCYGQMHGHNFPYPGAECTQCGVNQDELSGKLKPVVNDMKGLLARRDLRKEVKPLKGIHSELHGLVDELRHEFHETAKKGKGSFGFYLGLLRRISLCEVYQLRSQVKQSDCTDPGRLFWYKYRELLKSKKVDSSPSTNK